MQEFGSTSILYKYLSLHNISNNCGHSCHSLSFLIEIETAEHADKVGPFSFFRWPKEYAKGYRERSHVLLPEYPAGINTDQIRFIKSHYGFCF